MTWPKLLVLAAALLLGLLLQGGLYSVQHSVHPGGLGRYPLRVNRLTGKVEMFLLSEEATPPRWIVLEERRP